MKRFKKIAGLALALVMAFAMTLTAFAAGTGTGSGAGAASGSITIKDNTNVSVAGKTFNAYKILDVELIGEGYVYTVPDAMKSFYKGRYKLTGEEGDFDAKVVNEIGKEKDLFAFAKEALAAAKTAKITPGAATAGEGAASVTIGNLPLGYYVVEDAGTATPVSALMLDTTNPNVDIAIKADKPSVDKKIDGSKDTDDSTTGDVENNNAAVGDKVPYKVTSKVPDMTGYEKYYFVVDDTLSKGLTFNKDVAITVGSKTLVEDTDYTVTSTVNTDKTTSVEIVFKGFIQYKTETNADITITYSATVNENAVIGTTGNDNKVKLTYSNDPNTTDEGDPENPDKPTTGSPTGETPEETTRTYVTDIELIKVDPQGGRLTGAEFKIEGTKLNTVLVSKDVYTEDANGAYWKLKDGSYTTDDPSAEGMDQTKYESTTTKYSKTVETTPIKKAENVTYTAQVGADGVLRFEGLSAGEYTITEIKAPNGYNLLKDPITVTIGWTAPVAPSTECAWKYTGTDVVNGTSTSHITVTNQAGTELPSTGGTGTTLFYLIGGILVVIAAVLLVVRKRMSMEDK